MTTTSDVGAVIDDMVARGVFRAAPVKNDAGVVFAWRIKWFSGHEMRLAATDDEVKVDDVLPPLAAQSQLYRDLRVWLKAQQSADLPAHRRVDPTRIALKVKNSGGQIRLSLSSHSESSATLAKRMLQLIHALYLDFLNGPGRLEWVTEAFGLDPDNPRFS
ncbi:MAG: hypothetical protein IPO13_03855 [Rhodocyclaceae bacterium]|nr:hypothetical protein [Rhodocyclaceae bacterium]